MIESSMKLLLVEDSAADARLVLYELRQAGLEPNAVRVDTEEDFLNALAAEPDAILCDYGLPRFDAMRALELARERFADVPFFVVSGALGEEIAVQLIRQGANDCILKSRLERLASSLRQALEQRRLKRAERHAQEALRASEEQYRALADNIPQLVFMAQLDGFVVYVNRRFSEYSGLPAEALGGLGLRQLLHPDDQVAARSRRETALATGDAQEMEYRIRRADGQYRWHSLRVVPIHDANGQIARWLGTHTDIHDQKEAAVRLARDALLLASVRDSIIVTDLDGIVTYWNDGATRLFGWTADEMMGRPYADRFPESARAEIMQHIVQRGAGSDWDAEFEDFHKDGSRLWIHARVSRISDASGKPTGILGLAYDIRARRRLEEQYRQAQKMEAFGQLAGGVAHDFNNLLTVIHGAADILITQLPTNDARWDLLAAIREASERAAGLTAQLLAFSRKTIVEPRVLQPNSVVEQISKLLRRLLGEDITISTQLAPDLHCVKVDPGQLDQVIMNLSLNARDAMPTGGRLTLETLNVELRPQDCAPDRELRPGQYVVLKILDTGCGMSEAVKAKLFEPFFTTKPVGKGTGLGLATVYGITKTHGGHIEVWSEPGRGTAVTVYFPAERAAATPLPAKNLAQPKLGHETLLVVEDEPAVRRLLYLALVRQGYKVLEAKDGAEAIRIAESTSQPIHLLLTDVVMPGMGGREVARQVLQRHAEIRVLYLSGYTDDAIVRHGVIEATDNLLAKPFTPLSLANRVREILDRPR